MVTPGAVFIFLGGGNSLFLQVKYLGVTFVLAIATLFQLHLIKRRNLRSNDTVLEGENQRFICSEVVLIVYYSSRYCHSYLQFISKCA